LLIVPTDGSPTRELFRLVPPDKFGAWRTHVWTADSTAVVAALQRAGRREMWLLPLAGEPRKLDVDSSSWMAGAVDSTDQGFSLSPDGRRIAFVIGTSKAEVWALENVLPAFPGRR
jgi:hypothetical protein